jgi:hypothetical protein
MISRAEAKMINRLTTHRYSLKKQILSSPTPVDNPLSPPRMMLSTTSLKKQIPSSSSARKAGLWHND